MTHSSAPPRSVALSVRVPVRRHSIAPPAQGTADAVGRDRIGLVLHHPGGTEHLVLAAGGSAIIGRGQLSTVRIQHQSLSPRHTRLLVDGVQLLVEDLGSVTGTWLNGERITAASVSSKASLSMGEVIARLRSLRDEQEPAPLVAHDALRILIAHDLRRARHLRTNASMLMLRGIGGDTSTWAHRVRAALRSHDAMADYGGGIIEVFLSETGRDAAAAIGRAISDSGGPTAERIVFGVATFPFQAGSTDELVSECRTALAQQESTDQHHPTSHAPANRLSPAQAAPLSTHRWQPIRHIQRTEEGFICASPVMQQISSTISKVANADIPVLIHGETGVGKEVVAHMLHKRSSRNALEVICVNCGALPQQLIESTLFGHKRGAFTGADSDKAGLFDAADGSTLFLDEIGELPLMTQAALLRVLETGRVTSVGATSSHAVDVRIVAATHQDLQWMVDKGTFRQDLLFRLNAVTVAIPPLRERPEDLTAMIQLFFQNALKAHRREIRGLSTAALDALTSHSWPGNVRELRNVLVRAVLMAQDDVVDIAALPAWALRHGVGRGRAPDVADTSGSAPEETVLRLDATANFKDQVRMCEERILLRALREADGNQTAAATALSIPRRTLVHKIKTLGLKGRY